MPMLSPRRPALSICSVTDASPEQTVAFLQAWRDHADEIVLAVDERAPAGTPEAAAPFVDVLRVIPAITHVEQCLAWLYAQCSGDWLLRVDDDELPTDALVAELPKLLAARELTHVLLPCRWLTPAGDRYLDEYPWTMDVHPRLVRALPGLQRSTGRVHTEVEILGPHRITRAPFLHVTAALDDAATRRERTARYEAIGGPQRLEAGEPVATLYLPEDRPQARTAPLAPADAARVATFLERCRTPTNHPPLGPRVVDVDTAEIESHLDERWRDGDHDGEIRILDHPERIAAGVLRHVQVEVTNTGAGVWSCGNRGWPQIRLGHRWFDEDGGMAFQDTPRTFFTERVVPGATTRLACAVRSPVEPGRYELRIDLVEEDQRWFEVPACSWVEITGEPRDPPAEPRRRDRTWLHRAPNPARQFTEDLRRLNDVLATTSLRWWVWGGMLLGWAREGRLLRHDLNDADFAFRAGDPAFPAAATALMDAGFAPHRRFVSNTGCATEWAFHRGDAKFEFWALEDVGELLQYHVFADGTQRGGPPVEAIAHVPAQPLDRFRFLGRTWNKVVDHELELQVLYGPGWREPEPDWWYMHDCAITLRRPWLRTDATWDGDLSDLAPCTQ